ncbi:TPA: chemotaxis protein CheX [Candidatus Poribacteria bacterium]|nr:chemotaxis protein CheX [Candidatus Poribacteria bacterium]
MKERLIRSIIEGTKQVFQTMLSLDPIPGEPKESKKNSMKVSGITGIIGFAGEEGSCVLYIKCTDDVAEMLASRMLGTEFNGMSEEVRDVLGEIANMISGNVNSFLSEMGLEFKLSIPTIISGEGYEIDMGDENLCSLWIPFRFDGGEFDIIFAISLKRSSYMVRSATFDDKPHHLPAV